MEKDKKISLKEMAAASQFNKERDYWLTRLSGELVKSIFPPSFQQPAPQKPGAADNNMQAVTFRFEGDLFTRLMKLRNGLDSTLHMALVAGIVLLLEKYTGNNDIIVGTTILKQETEANFINTVLALRNRLEPHMTFKDLLLQVRQTVMEAVIHQNYPIEKLLYQLDIPGDPGSFPLFDTGIILQNIHERNYFRRIDLNILFSFFRNQEFLEGTLEYNILFYDRSSMQRLVQHFTYLMHQVIFDVDMKLSRVQVLSPRELKQILWDFNDTGTDYPAGRTVHELFAGQVEKTPLHTAIIHKDKTLTLKQVDASACRLANYLYREKGICPDEIVGILMNNSPELVIAMLGVLKAGGAYVPLDPSLPGERLRFILKDAQVRVAISLNRYIRDLNRLQWECPSLVTFLCMDSWDVYNEEEQERNELMDKKLWEYIGETAVDSITGGGWLTSYTGQPFMAAEMQEYTRNITIKLTPLLHKDMRVLEIGCASGLSMFSLAPMVGFYYGTDLSKVIIEKDKETVWEKGLENIRLACLPAHEIEKLEEKNFDLVIMNSVIQSFHGHNYLRKVIGKVIDLMGEKGYIFIGDVMDHDKKTALEQEMLSFKWANRGKDYKTKTDWSSELFVARAFFHDIPGEFPQVKELTFSDKIYTHENELTKFRYDVLMTVEKTAKNKENQGKRHKNKFQEDLRALERNDTAWESEFPAGWNHLAYMIYTSGTTGKPRGVMIDQQSLVNYLYWAIKRYTGPGERATFPLYTTPSFDLTVTSIYLPLLTGSPLIIYDQDKQDNGQIPVQEIIEHNAVDLVKATPSHLKILQYTYINSPGDVNRDSPINRSRVRAFIVGGEELTGELARAIYRHFPGKVDIYNEYGPTEATVGCMIHKFNHTADRRRGVPIGVPVDNVKIYLLNESLNAVPSGAAGEICIGGDALARGYLNLPELTAEKFIKNPYLPPGTCHASRLYKTGDLACLIPGDLLEYIGRKDEQVKIRGYRVEIKDIENRLLELEEIDKVVVTAQTDDGGETYLCAYYEAQEELDNSEIRKYLSAGLPDYMIPSYFVRIDRIPLTLNGKVDKKALLGIKIGGRNLRDKYIPPRNRLEETLVDIWARVLKLDKTSIGIDSDFFEFGGHSLRATVLVANIHKELEVKIPLAEIFRTPNIRGLSRYIETKARDKFISITPVEKKEYHPVSSQQMRLYILHRMKEIETSYNEFSVIELGGRLDRQNFTRALTGLTRRHEALRTFFKTVNGEIVQGIASEAEFQVEAYEVDEGGEPIEGIINGFLKPFDLGKAPLMRVGLIRVTGERHMLIYDLHHIITDGTSMGILMREFIALYAGEQLPGLRIQYKDYSEWQKSRKGEEALKDQEAYWCGQFKGEIPALLLPADYPRPGIQDFVGDRIHFRVGMEETRAIKEMAARQEVTLYMLLLAIINVLFARVSGQEDIVMGTPIAARRHADLQAVIGMFVNTLALRNYPAASLEFNTFLKQIKNRTMEAFENQEYPFEELVEKVTLHRDISHNPLFDTVFALQNMEIQETGSPGVQRPGLMVKSYDFQHKISKFDLTLHAYETGNVLSFTLEYSTRLFKEETIRRFIDFFRRIISFILEHPGEKIGQIEIISEEEKIQVLNEFNKTAEEYPRDKTIHELFARQAERNPDHIALDGKLQITNYQPYVQPGGGAAKGGNPGRQGYYTAISYRELNEVSGRLAYWLKEKGVAGDVIVGLMTGRSIEMVIGLLGILKAGGAYIPIDPGNPQERIDYLLKDSKPVVLLTATAIEENVNRSNKSHLTYISPGNPLAYIMYTSGSTGRPRGVMVTHRNVVRLVKNTNFVDLSERTRILETGAPEFDATTFETWGSLLNGGLLCLVDNEVILESKKLGRALENHQINTMWLTSPLFNQLMQQDSGIFAPLEYLVVGGDVLPPKAINAVRHRNRHLKVVNGYGPTENTTFSACYTLDRDFEYNIPIGKPINNSTTYIVDRHNRLQPLGIPGELWVGGDGVARGYLNNPELTAEKFDHDLWDYLDYQEEKVPGKRSYMFLEGTRGLVPLFSKAPGTDPLQSCNHAVMRSYSHAAMPSLHYPIPPLPHSPIYRTGDLAKWLTDGNIEFLGRLDNQIKIRGFRVEPGEIENRLSSHQEIKEAVVLVVDNENGSGDRLLCAYFTGSRELNLSELREYLARELPGYMIPAYFVQLEKMPLTPNGKLDRKALPEPRLKPGKENDAPVDRLEEQILEIWTGVLGISKNVIGMHDDFFHLGGHSLKATLLAARISKTFNVEFPLTDVFTGPTIKEMAETIRQCRKSIYEEIKPVEKKEYYPQSSAQKRLFFLEQFENIGIAYNIPSVLKVEGKLDMGRFENALNALICRHETLRTSLRLVNNEPVQVIHHTADFKIENPGFSRVKDKVTIAGIVKKFVRPFDLSRAPLIRVGFAALSQEESLIMYDIHHIIGDGTSMGILITDFLMLYDQEEIMPLKTQYKDFTSWQNRMIETGEIQKQEEYWLNIYRESPKKFDFPTDYPRPGSLSFEGDRYVFILEQGDSVAVKSLAAENGATLFMVLLAAFYVLLYKYSGQNDIVVGTGIMGRPHVDLMKNIGMFVNSLAIRNYPTGEKTCRQFLAEVKDSCVQAFANQDVQFEELVDHLNLERDPSRNPLFDILLVVQNFEQAKLEDFRQGLLDDIRVTPYAHENKTSKFDLNLSAWERDNDILFNLEYATALFKSSTIREIAANYLEIIRQVIYRRDIHLEEVTIAADLLEVKSTLSTVDKSEFIF